MPVVRTIRVFIASPGDLAVERRAFKDVIEELNDGFGDGAGVKFEPLGWEDTLASTGRRSQSIINLEVDRCDVFVLALYARWGQDAPDAQPYSSYTEEEFHRALDRWKQTGAPEIFVFFKHLTPREMGDPGPQLQKVLAFRKSLEESRQVFYRGFADAAKFQAEVDRHLRAFAKGELPKADAPLDKVLLPLAIIEEVQKVKAEKEQALARAEHEHQFFEAALARAEKLALEFSERAAKAALEGRVEEARQDFAKATEGTVNLEVLQLAFEFYFRTGDLVTAEELLERWLAISDQDAETAGTARALSNLGLIYQTAGDLKRSEEMLRKALDINEKLGQQAGLAAQYGNLGTIYGRQSKLNQAEEMFRKSLAIFEKLDHQEGVASAYGNIGNIYQRRCEMERAEEMYHKVLAIEAKLGRQESIANTYGNLGIIYSKRGEMERAEEMYRKAMEIEEKVCHLEGMARQYENLGWLAKDRGELERARELWMKGCDLFAKIGMPHEIKKMQEWLDRLSPVGAGE